MKTNNKSGVFAALRMAARAHYPLTIGTLLCVAASVITSLLPPLLLARIIDGLTAGLPLTIWAVLVYFASLALEGVLSSAQESLLVLFGQKMTHALRSEMSHKLTQLPARTLVDQNPGEVAARFSGDVDTVEALFTSGIISMVADACRIFSIVAVIAAKNPGLALILLLALPLFAAFTRRVQRRIHHRDRRQRGDAAPVDLLDRAQRDAVRSDLHDAAHQVVVGDQQHAPRYREDAADAHEGVHLIEDVRHDEGEPDDVRDHDGKRPAHADAEEGIDEVGDGVGTPDGIGGLHLHLGKADDRQTDAAGGQHQRHAGVGDGGVGRPGGIVALRREVR